MDFSNLDSLFDHLEKAVDISLKRETAQAVVKTMQKHIKDDIYSVYTPEVYQRHYYNDGLLDEDNIEVQVTDSGISVESIRHEGDRNIAEIIESGVGYYANADSVLTDGRPFTERTREELRTSNILEQAMKDGLNRQGIDSRLK